MNPVSALLAHHENLREAFGPGSSGPLQDAAGASALVMVALIVFLCGGVAVFALTLRRRSLHPSPEGLLLAEIGADADSHDFPPQGSGARSAAFPSQAWERPDDWWKSPSRRP